MVTALLPDALFDGAVIHRATALVLDDGRIAAVVHVADLTADLPCERLPGLLAPGFIDLQVNGGGGVLLNDRPTPAAMAGIAAAHRPFGTTGVLPTLITADAATTERALDAAVAAVRDHPGVLGLHLEGPHLAPARRGVHCTELMRPLTDAAVDRLLTAKAQIGPVLLTVAAEQAPPELVRRLADGGVVVSLGHSDATFEDAMAAFAAGARAATHLFNAMSPLAARAPGLVGAVLEHGPAFAGIIADGHHVHPASLRMALRAKRGPGRLFLVTDAMPTLGTGLAGFALAGHQVRRSGGRLTLADGTLAGAHLDMAAAVRFARRALELPLEEALRMASLYPAQLIGIGHERGRLVRGAVADLVLLDPELQVAATWIAGRRG